MNTELSSQPSPAPTIREFFIGRQPILGRDQNLVAYELLFRHARVCEAEIIDDLCATASVIEHAAQLGIENVIGDALAFFNVDAAVLMCDFVRFLPCDRVVLEILETVNITPELVRRVEELAASGLNFALDDVVAYQPEMQAVLPLIKIIKVDISNMRRSELEALAKRFKQENKLILAEKVETVEQFQDCLNLGFDYFQGYYFARPDILSGKKLDPSVTAIMQLMALVLSGAENEEIERHIRLDPSLSMTLLRLVNSSGVGISQRITSIKEAVAVLGRRQLERWLHIVLYAGKREGSHVVLPLLLLATTRGKLMESVAERLQPNDRNTGSIAFTVGIMSLIDALLGKPMDEVICHFPVAPEVREALLEQRGFYRDLLSLAEALERPDGHRPMLLPLLKKLNISLDDLYSLQMEAFNWSNKIVRQAK